MSSHSFGWSFAALCLLAPRLTSAGAYYVSDVGARGMGRAGAFVAAPDSLLALHYNPAGLALLDGPNLEIDGTFVSFDFEFSRSCPCADPALENRGEIDALLSSRFVGRTASNDTGLQPIPFLAVGWGFPKLMGLSVALGAWGPPSFRELYYGGNAAPAGDSQPQRYTASTLDLFEAYYTLGVAFAPFEKLRIGATAALYDYGTTQSTRLWANTRLLSPSSPENAESAEWDIPVDLDFRKTGLLNWGFGVSYEVIPSLSVGASVLGKRSIRADGKAIISLPETLQGTASVTGDQVEVEVNLAPVTRFGVQLDLPELIRAEAAVVVEAWSVLQDVRIRSKNVEITLNGVTSPLTPVRLERGLSDAFSIRLGAELAMLEPWLTIRAGYFFEPSTVPEQRLTADLPDLDKHGLSLGASSSWRGITMSIGGQLVLLPETIVTDSEVRLTQLLLPPQGSPDLLTTQGNGAYSGSYFIISGSLSVAFDPLLG
ncbi:MAG: outer membrane protein transport protein [Deltaproteobacteria bacterium]|nr:outer membrane protein transport protein [Deltaproteobacteria bacterium]